MTIRDRRRGRKGNILVLSAFSMVFMIAMLAFSIDLGYLMVAKTELQRSADSAAIAATWDLIDPNGPAGSADSSQTTANARATASEFAGLNWVLKGGPDLSQDDVRVGYLANPSDPNATLDESGAVPPNAVRVMVRRADDLNGKVPFFFGPMLGKTSEAADAEATAALLNNFRGFGAPSNGSNLCLLPFALDQQSWNGLLAGIGTDDWTWDDEDEQVTAGSDGILEVNLYPQGTGSPGNRGTVDIGSSNNSTADIARQIVDGISSEDLEYHGGELVLDENGEIMLNADTGISAGVKDELESIKGKPRMIPVFSTVVANGNNAQYTIVQFIGIRIMEVNLTGQMSSKRVIIQPANVVCQGGIPNTEITPTSYFVYSPVWLVR